jgi:hypothetical protein
MATTTTTMTTTTTTRREDKERGRREKKRSGERRVEIEACIVHVHKIHMVSDQPPPPTLTRMMWGYGTDHVTESYTLNQVAQSVQGQVHKQSTSENHSWTTGYGPASSTNDNEDVVE